MLVAVSISFSDLPFTSLKLLPASSCGRGLSSGPFAPAPRRSTRGLPCLAIEAKVLGFQDTAAANSYCCYENYLNIITGLIMNAADVGLQSLQT